MQFPPVEEQLAVIRRGVVDLSDEDDLRKRLEDAVRGERYEEAAQLRDDLRRAERSDER